MGDIVRNRKIKEKPFITCLTCNVLTTNRKFCSQSCAGKFNCARSPRKYKIKLCASCTEPVKSSRHKLCNHHWDNYKDTKWKGLTFQDCVSSELNRGNPRSFAQSRIRSFARRWLSDMTKLPCSHCGYDKHVELAHVKAVSSFPIDTPLSIINSRDNLTPLCPNCHWEFDNLPRKE